MKIATFHNLPSGGAKRALHEWVKRLSMKHTIDVYTLSSSYHSYLDIRPFVNNHIVYHFSSHNLFKSPFGRLNQLQRLRDLHQLAHIGKLIADEINSGGYDILFIQPCMFTYMPSFIHMITIPSIYYLHEPFGKTITRSFIRPYFKQNNWLKTFNRIDPLYNLYNISIDRIREINLRNTSLFLANSKFTEQCMRIDYSLEVPVCYYGVDYEAFRPLSSIRKEYIVLSVGELTPRKGFDFLIQSLAHISPSKRPRLRLISNYIDENERKYLELLASEFQVKLEVFYNLDTQEIVAEYNRAIITAYSPINEPFGLVPIESMACGTPVVGVLEGGYQEAIIHNHTGSLVNRDPYEFAFVINDFLSKPELAHEFGQNARKHVVNNWSWEKSVATLEKYLFDCANKI